MRKLMHSFEVHSDESACRKSGRLGLEQVLSLIYATSPSMVDAFLGEINVENYENPPHNDKGVLK